MPLDIHEPYAVAVPPPPQLTRMPAAVDLELDVWAFVDGLHVCLVGHERHSGSSQSRVWSGVERSGASVTG